MMGDLENLGKLPFQQVLGGIIIIIIIALNNNNNNTHICTRQCSIQLNNKLTRTSVYK